MSDFDQQTPLGGPQTVLAPAPPRLPAPPAPPRLTAPPIPPNRGGTGFRSSSQPAAPPLKPFFWTPLKKAVQGSLWEAISTQSDSKLAQEFDTSEIENLFPAPVKVPKSADGDGSVKNKIHLIDMKRANNTLIMLSRIKLVQSDLMDAILAMDDSVLNVDQVENLAKFCPTEDEKKCLMNYNGDKERLGKCEQYFLELIKVPRIATKLQIFSFKIQFRCQMTEFKESVNTVTSACDEVRSSEKLIEVMKRILYLGNTLNRGTPRGSAVGFKLDGLSKLSDTRASINKMTLMDYLCKVIASKAPMLLDFHNDLTNLESASKIQLNLLAEEMKAMKEGVEMANCELSASVDDVPMVEVFRKALEDFILFAVEEVISATELYSAMSEKAERLASFFGEDPSRYPFEQVISTVLNFTRQFQKAHGENVRNAELEKKRAEANKVKESTKRWRI